MRHFFANLISVCCSFLKFSFIKLFHYRHFNFFWIERFSPNVIVKIGKKSTMRLGKRVRVHSGSKIMSVAGGDLNIGDDCRINYNCMIVCRHKIEISKGVEFGPNVLIYDHDHDVRADGGIKAGKYRCSSVVIGENTWIGANTIILRGTKIGDNCVIGAGSVVKGEIPDNTVFIQKKDNILLPLDR